MGKITGVGSDWLVQTDDACDSHDMSRTDSMTGFYHLLVDDHMQIPILKMILEGALVHSNCVAPRGWIGCDEHSPHLPSPHSRFLYTSRIALMTPSCGE